MSEQQGVIANALGGFTTPAFLEFYPNGVSEYTGATKTNLPVLIGRINAAATAHAGELGAIAYFNFAGVYISLGRDTQPAGTAERKC